MKNKFKLCSKTLVERCFFAFDWPFFIVWVTVPQSITHHQMNPLTHLKLRNTERKKSETISYWTLFPYSVKHPEQVIHRIKSSKSKKVVLKISVCLVLSQPPKEIHTLHMDSILQFSFLKHVFLHFHLVYTSFSH